MIDFIERLQRKNCKVTEIPNWGIYFRKRWEDNFISHLNQAEKERIYLYADRYACGYLWYVFSYETIEYLSKLAANDAFDVVKKSKCYIFYQRTQDILIVESAAALKAADIIGEEDIYIVDKNFTWTYVVTHESDCGPYFCIVQN